MNGLDLIIIVCAAIGLIKGLFSGFIKQIVSFIALAAAIFFAGQIAIIFRKLLFSHTSEDAISSQIVNGLCYVLAFVLIIFVIYFIGKVISSAIKMTPVRPFDTLLGGLFGVFIWIFSLSLLFNVLSAFDAHSTIISKKTQEKSALYYKVKHIVPTLYPND